MGGGSGLGGELSPSIEGQQGQCSFLPLGLSSLQPIYPRRQRAKGSPRHSAGCPQPKHSSWSGVSTLELPYRCVGRSPSPAHGRRKLGLPGGGISLYITRPSGDRKTTLCPEISQLPQAGYSGLESTTPLFMLCTQETQLNSQF